MPVAVPHVVAVAQSATHSFSRPVVPAVQLVAGLGVEGDAHCGRTVKHRSRVAADPSQPNLRQLHLLHVELFHELASKGFALTPGAIGENILTSGIDLLGLPRGATLAIGASAVVEVTGLRNPCHQLDTYQKGLLAAVLDRAEDGSLIRKAGIMGIVRAGGAVCAGDLIRLTLPAESWERLDRV